MLITMGRKRETQRKEPYFRTFTQQLTVSKSEWQGPNEPWNQRNKPASGKWWLAGACRHAKHTLTAQVVHLLWCALPRASLEIMLFHVFLRSISGSDRFSDRFPGNWKVFPNRQNQMGHRTLA